MSRQKLCKQILMDETGVKLLLNIFFLTNERYTTSKRKLSSAVKIDVCHLPVNVILNSSKPFQKMIVKESVRKRNEDIVILIPPNTSQCMISVTFLIVPSKGAFHLSELTGQPIPIVMRISLLININHPQQSNPTHYAQRRWFFSKTSWKTPISLPKCLVWPWFGRPVLTYGKRRKRRNNAYRNLSLKFAKFHVKVVIIYHFSITTEDYAKAHQEA